MERLLRSFLDIFFSMGYKKGEDDTNMVLYPRKVALTLIYVAMPKCYEAEPIRAAVRLTVHNYLEGLVGL